MIYIFNNIYNYRFTTESGLEECSQMMTPTTSIAASRENVAANISTTFTKLAISDAERFLVDFATCTFSFAKEDAVVVFLFIAADLRSELMSFKTIFASCLDSTFSFSVSFPVPSPIRLFNTLFAQRESRATFIRQSDVFVTGWLLFHPGEADSNPKRLLATSVWCGDVGSGDMRFPQR